jgi:hypothetical protein
MADIILKLARYLESTRTDYGPGADSREIAMFTSSENVPLPNELVSYFQLINGTNGNYAPGLVSLWGLRQIVRLSCDLSSSKSESAALIQSAYRNTSFNANQYFVFADFMQEAKIYAILIGECERSGEVIMLDGEAPTVVAKSFSEFIELLMIDPASIGGDPDGF